MSFTTNNNAGATASSFARSPGPRARPLSSSSYASLSSTRRSRYHGRHSSSSSMSYLSATPEPMAMLSVHGHGLGGTSSPETDTGRCSKCGSTSSSSYSMSTRRLSEPVLPMDSNSMTLLWSSMRALSMHGSSPSSSNGLDIDENIQASTSLSGSSIRPKRPTQLLDLPSELLFSILSWLVPDTIISKCTWDHNPTLASPDASSTPCSALLGARATCRRLSTVALALLRPVMARDLAVLTLATSHARSRAAEVEHDAQPALAHNRRFLRTLSTSHLRELTSLSRPPEEIHQVASALVHLIFPLDAAREYAAGGWRGTRRALARPETRTWLTQVHARGPPAVVSGEAGLAAARGIVAGMGITYDRMKAVSVTGYRMLIVVAAAIQYCEHAGRVAAAVDEYDRVATRLDKVGKMYGVAVRDTVHSEDANVEQAVPEMMEHLEVDEGMAEWEEGVEPLVALALE